MTGDLTARYAQRRIRTIRRSLAYWSEQPIISDRRNLYAALQAGLAEPKTHRHAVRVLEQRLDAIEAFGDQAQWAKTLTGHPETFIAQIIRGHLLASLGQVDTSQRHADWMTVTFAPRRADDRSRWQVLLARQLLATNNIANAYELLRLLSDVKAGSQHSGQLSNLMAICALRLGKTKDALKFIVAAERSAKRIAHTRRHAVSLQNKALILNADDEPAAALKTIDLSIRMFDELGASIYRFNAIAAKGWLLVAQGQAERVPAYLSIALAGEQNALAALPTSVLWKLDSLYRYLEEPAPFYFANASFVPRLFSWQMIENTPQWLLEIGNAGATAGNE